MGKLLVYVSMFLLFLLDMFSLVLLAGMYGVGWAFVAFFVVPAQLLVPFLVGTWLPMLVLIAVGFLGFMLDSRKNNNLG
jgi:hypothetical protein